MDCYSVSSTKSTKIILEKIKKKHKKKKKKTNNYLKRIYFDAYDYYQVTFDRK